MNTFPCILAAAIIGIPALAAETAQPAAATAAVPEKAAFSGVPAKVTANVLNARLTADLKSPAAKKLRKGDAVVITGVKGNWYEIAAPQGTMLYASGVYLRDGKALEKTSLRISAGPQAPAAAVLAKGDTVKVLGDAGYGWVKVEAPATLKLHVAKFYVETDEKAVAALTAAPKAEAPKTEAPKAAAPVAEKAPAAQLVSAPAKKAEQAVQPAAAAAKPAAVAPKKEVKKPLPQQDPVKVRKMQDEALKEIGVDPAKADHSATLSGKLIRVPESANPASNFALLLRGGEDFVFVCTAPEAVSMWIDQEITIRGDVFQPAGWKHQVLRADDIKVVR